MAIVFRLAVAVSVLPLLAAGAFASPEMEAAFNLPGWAESCALPSVTASSPIVTNSPFRLVSDDQPAADDSAKGDTSGTNCSECDACGMCCCCCPTWYASAGSVILHRDRPDGGAILQPVGIGPAINAADFDFGWNGGLDITVGRRDCCCNGWEARYFNDIGASSLISIQSAPITFRIAQGAPANVIAADASYNTDLHSFEINYRSFSSPTVTFLGGFRYLEIDDTLNFDLTLIGGQTPQYYWNESNNLYGGQVGTDVSLWGGNSPFSLNSIFKIGMYGLAADNNFINTPAAGPVVQDGGFETDIAWVGEIDFVGTYRLCQNVALRGGYQLLWIENIATASDQAINATTAISGAGIDTNGDLFYNGATVALVFTR